MITLEIHLLSKIEMPVLQAQDFIARDFPGIDTDTFTIRSNQQTGMVSLTMNQDALSDEQDSWLRTSTFAACYIDWHYCAPQRRSIMNMILSHYELQLILIALDQDITHSPVPEDQEEKDRRIPLFHHLTAFKHAASSDNTFALYHVIDQRYSV